MTYNPTQGFCNIFQKDIYRAIPNHVEKGATKDHVNSTHLIQFDSSVLYTLFSKFYIHILK